MTRERLLREGDLRSLIAREMDKYPCGDAKRRALIDLKNSLHWLPDAGFVDAEACGEPATYSASDGRDFCAYHANAWDDLSMDNDSWAYAHPGDKACQWRESGGDS